MSVFFFSVMHQGNVLNTVKPSSLWGAVKIYRKLKEYANLCVSVVPCDGLASHPGSIPGIGHGISD